MASANEELNFKFYFILINLNLDSRMWPVALILYNTALECVLTNNIRMVVVSFTEEDTGYRRS